MAEQDLPHQADSQYPVRRPHPALAAACLAVRQHLHPVGILPQSQQIHHKSSQGLAVRQLLRFHLFQKDNI